LIFVVGHFIACIVKSVGRT